MLPTTLTVANKTSNYTLLESESGDIVFNYMYLAYMDGGYTCGLNYGLDPNY